MSTALTGDAWREWERYRKQELRDRLAVAYIKAGRRVPGVDYPDTPGELAVSLAPRKVQQRPHLEVIDSAFRRVHTGDVDRILILCPPQVGKTQRAAVWAPFWWLVHHPTDPIILVSYGATLAATRGRMTRYLIRQYGLRFGLEIDPEHSASNDWAVTAGGGMRTGGMNTGVTGNPSALLIIDDPHKDRAEADSALLRTRVWETYSSTLLSRLTPGAPVVLIQTRWHEDDLAGRVVKEEGSLAEGGRWLVLHMPAIAGEADPLGRAPGEPLIRPDIAAGDTEAALAHWLEKRRTSTVRDWYALYQGDPRPAEGALVAGELLVARRDYRPMARPQIIAVAVDPSGGGRDVAGIIGGFLGDDGRLYWTHDRSGVMSADAWTRTACQLARDIGADRLVYESNFGGDMARFSLRTAWERLDLEAQEKAAEAAVEGGASPAEVAAARAGAAWGLPPRIVEVHSKRGKVLRAEPIAQQIAEDRIRLADHMPELEHEWCSWRPTDSLSPGRIDASVHLAYQLLPVPGAAALVSNPARPVQAFAGGSALSRARIAR